ncbi:hypothetical protein FDJ19_gp140 [Vibrio phage Ceto]|uniref:Macro domain-containing protein n=1 Tax=Vibrio phage Ceto TaxID=2570300 RepID=A0A2H5BGR2_9CAUD|nr:hypothetical protein FDJ19_gp140 [Vibrio phage Ceto]AUG85158.1 hypothetical protein CETO_176 [Vibrio phage Ceto]
MIKVVKGDMVKHLQSKDHLDAYAHQCNCFCRMGRGIAPLLAKAVPGLRQADDMTVPGDKSKLGSVSLAAHPNGAVVFNVYGQYHWHAHKVAPGRNTDYDALEKGLWRVLADMLKDDMKTLGLPLIGCGLAGGDWDNVVLPMIHKVFDNSGVDVTIFKL